MRMLGGCASMQGKRSELAVSGKGHRQRRKRRSACRAVASIPTILALLLVVGACGNHTGETFTGSISQPSVTCADDSYDWTGQAQLESLPTEELGTIPGLFEVSSGGAATYTMPIEVLKGPGGLQPSLSISYHSDNGNGLLGVGFVLSGLSAIAPCPGNYALDGYLGKQTFYIPNTQLCLDGKRLVAVNAAGTEYRTYPDTFAKIKASNGPMPQRFRVWTKEGLILDYGVVPELSGDDRETAIVWHGTTSEIRAWLVRRVTDRFGNTMVYSYDHVYADAAGPSDTRPTLEYAPSTIDYGQRTLRLGDARGGRARLAAG